MTPPDYVPATESPVNNSNSPEYPSPETSNILEIEEKKEEKEEKEGEKNESNIGEKKTVSFELKPGVAESSTNETKKINL